MTRGAAARTRGAESNPHDEGDSDRSDGSVDTCVITHTIYGLQLIDSFIPVEP